MNDKPRIYMDACCFIDMAKQAARILPSGRGNEVWFLRNLLEAAKDKEIQVYTSVLSVVECTHADGNVNAGVRDTFTRLLMSGQYVTLVQPTPFVAADGRDLRWKHGIMLHGADYLHVASAISVQCAEFLTTDGRITKNAGKIKMLGLQVLPAEQTACLPDKYKQGRLDENITVLKPAQGRGH